MTKKTPLGLVLIGLLLGALGCATPLASTRPTGPATLPRPAAPPPAPAEAVVAEADEATPIADEPGTDPYFGVQPTDARLHRAVRLSREYYDRARERWRVGDADGARGLFEQAAAVLREGELAVRPDAQALAAAVAAQGAAYDAAVEGEDGDETVAESDLDDGGDELAGEPAAIDSVEALRLPDEVSPPQVPEPDTGTALFHDVPLVVNNQVQYMLDVYKGRLKDEIQPAFERSGRWLPMIQTIFREEGVPLDLAWLSLVESGFKPNAYSRAAAKGLWQFIRSTGRLYGLDVTFWVDERSDPEQATRAAARHLKDLYAHYGDWYLSLAAYNAGAGKVDRAIKRVGSKDYWAIARSRHLRPETKNYVPAFLATLLIAEDPKRHGFDFVPEPPIRFEPVTIDGQADLSVLAGCAGTTVEELRRLNPELRRDVTPSVPSFRLRVPPGSADRFAVAWAAVPPNERLRFAVHRVARGETVARIAAAYGVSARGVAEANGLGRSTRVTPGSELRIPLSRGFAVPANWSEDERPRRQASSGGRYVYHTVRRGETLSAIASRYSVTIRDLRSWNGLRSNRIQAGSRLKVGRGTASTGGRRSGRSMTHRVERGETLHGIAGRYGVSVDDLRQWNDGLSGRGPQAGERLRVGAN